MRDRDAGSPTAPVDEFDETLKVLCGGSSGGPAARGQFGLRHLARVHVTSDGSDTVLHQRPGRIPPARKIGFAVQHDDGH